MSSDNKRMVQTHDAASKKLNRLSYSKNHIQSFIAGILVTVLVAFGGIITFKPNLLTGVAFSSEETQEPIFYRAFPDVVPDSLSVESEGYYVGELALLPWDFTPVDFAQCKESRFLPTQYYNLFSLIGNSYGGNGVTSFAVPAYDTQVPLQGLKYNILTDGIVPNSGDVKAITSNGINYYPSTKRGNERFLGEIILAKNDDEYTDTGRGIIPCDGRELDKGRYPALFSLIGTRFGGSDKAFKIPDLSNVASPIKGAKYYLSYTGIFPQDSGYHPINPTPTPTPTPTKDNIPTIYRTFFSSKVKHSLQVQNPNPGELFLYPYGDTYKEIHMSDFDAVRCEENVTVPILNTIFYSVISDIGELDNNKMKISNFGIKTPIEKMDFYIVYNSYVDFNDTTSPVMTSVNGIDYYAETSVQEYLSYNALIGNIFLAKNFSEELMEDMYLLPCDGREISISNNQTIFYLIGTRFGGDGVNTFKLPDMTNVSSPIDGAKYYIVTSGVFPMR